jgi:hypothetical protein
LHIEDVGGPDLGAGTDLEFDIEQAPTGPRAKSVLRECVAARHLLRGGGPTTQGVLRESKILVIPKISDFRTTPDGVGIRLGTHLE